MDLQLFLLLVILPMGLAAGANETSPDKTGPSLRGGFGRPNRPLSMKTNLAVSENAKSLEGLDGVELALALSKLSSSGISANPFLFHLDGDLIRFTPVSGLCVSVRNGFFFKGADLILWSCRDSKEFLWRLDTDHIRLKNKPEYCLGLQRDESQNGVTLVLSSCDNSKGTKWLVDGTRIRHGANKNYCAGVREGLAGDGSDLILWSCDEAWLAKPDWIVVGGGASGCAVAASLVDAGESVIVIERGPSDLDLPLTQQAQTWPKVVASSAAELLRWEDGTWGAVAQVLGGGTSVNGGLFIAETSDYLKSLFPELDTTSLEQSFQYLQQNITTPLQPSQWGQDYAAALGDVGYKLSGSDPQLTRLEGAWHAISTIDTAAQGAWPRRASSALLHERAGLPNLQVLTEHQALRILFNGQQARGVRVKHGRDTFTLTANKGVILAAGAIYTPQLLQVSGVGESPLLDSLGVPVVADLPVGRNFVDRLVLTLAIWSSINVPLMVGYVMGSNSTRGLTLETEAGGHVASNFAIASLAFAPPEQRNQFLRWTFQMLFAMGFDNLLDNMMQLVALNHNTWSRGSVQAVSSNAEDPPSVTANYFADPRDMEGQKRAFKQVLELSQTEPVQKYTTPKAWNPLRLPLPSFLSCLLDAPNDLTNSVVLPCLPESDSSDEEWERWFRKNVISSYHYFGTAAYGKVVEGADFHVKGIPNLHVVDASIFPNPTRINPQGTIMAMGHYIGKRLAAGRRLAQDSQGSGGEAPVLV